MDENNFNADILNEEEITPEIEIIDEMPAEEIPEKDKKFCSFCGAELSDDAGFCIACGTKIAAVPERPITENAPVRTKISPTGYASFTKKVVSKKRSQAVIAYTALAYSFWAIALIMILNAFLTIANSSVSGMQFFSTDYTDILVRIGVTVVYAITSLNFTIVGSIMFLLSKKGKK